MVGIGDAIALPAVLRRFLVMCWRMEPSGLLGAGCFEWDNRQYGAHRRIHDAKSDYLSFDIPVVVEVVDSAENIGKMLNKLTFVPQSGWPDPVSVHPAEQVGFQGRTHENLLSRWCFQ